jgi:hypothetical protein
MCGKSMTLEMNDCKVELKTPFHLMRMGNDSGLGVTLLFWSRKYMSSVIKQNVPSVVKRYVFLLHQCVVAL